jgi:hypothetical protein
MIDDDPYHFSELPSAELTPSRFFYWPGPLNWRYTTGIEY